MRTATRRPGGTSWKTRCDNEFAGLPDRIPAEGLQVAHSLGTRFGVWIMPDNRFEGMRRPTASSNLRSATHDLSDSRQLGGAGMTALFADGRPDPSSPR